MLRNARDAHAKSVFTAVSREGQRRRRIVMVDDGDGVPAAMHEHVFEPRVTSKLDSMHLDKWGMHGRGMALYSIAVNAETAARRRLGRGQGRLASSWRRTSTSSGEKADQSSFPVFERTDAGSIAVRGPKNILRTACEFAIECRRDCTVYLGSVTDIAATLYAFGLSSLTAASRAFCAMPTSCRVQAPGAGRGSGELAGLAEVAGPRPVRALRAPHAGRRDRALSSRCSTACASARRRDPSRSPAHAAPVPPGDARVSSWPARTSDDFAGRVAAARTATWRDATTWIAACSRTCAWARTACTSSIPVEKLR